MQLKTEVFKPLEKEVEELKIDPQHLSSLRWCQSFEDLQKDLLQIFGDFTGRVVFVSDGVEKQVRGAGQETQSLDEAIASVFGKVGEFLELSPAEGYPQPMGLAKREVCERLRTSLFAQGNQDRLCIVVLGSGSVTDVVKQVFSDVRDLLSEGSLLVSIPTALTVTAFTSAFSVLESAGLKSTFPSCAPHRVLFCGAILSEAPVQLTQGGVGDLIAGFVSYADWKLANELGLAHDFQEQAGELMQRMNRRLREASGQVEKWGGASCFQDTGCLQTLALVLSAAGVAMNVAGSSAPQSGGEHAVSHVLDWLNDIQSAEKWIHGQQIAITSLASAALHDWVQSLEFIPYNWLFEGSASDVMGIVETMCQAVPVTQWSLLEKRSASEADGISAATVSVHDCESFRTVVQNKLMGWQSLRARWPEVQARWPEIQASVRVYLLSQSEIRSLCRAWRVSTEIEELEPSGRVDSLRWALRFSPFFRQRFGVQDLVFLLSEDPVHIAAL